MRHPASLLVALVATTAAGCAEVRVGVPDPAAAVTVTTEDGVPDVLAVDCTDGVVTIGSDTVRVRADGLHVEVTALPDATEVELRAPGGPDPLTLGSGGGAHRPGRSVLPGVAPGPLLVRCYPMEGPGHDVGLAEDPTTVAVEVVDPDGHWAPSAPLACDGMVSITSPLMTPPDPPREPAVPLLEVADPEGTGDVRVVGAPDATMRRWTETVVDGRVVARTAWGRDGHSWRAEGTTACAGAPDPTLSGDDTGA